MSIRSHVLNAALPAAVARLRGPAGAGAAEPPTIRAVAHPIANFTPLLIARDKGFFTEENLDVTWNSSPRARSRSRRCSAAAPRSAAARSSSRWSHAATASTCVLVASTRIRTRPRRTIPALRCATDDAIKDAKDLVGKKISAGLINSVELRPYAGMAAAAAASTPSRCSSSRLPFPQMADALFQNRLDAVWNVEPFLTFMLKSGQGARHRLSLRRTTSRAWTSPPIMCKESWVKANPDVARRFKRALRARHQVPRRMPQGRARRLGCEIHRHEARGRQGR